MTSRSEMIRIVARLCEGGDGDEEDTAILDRLQEELPHSDISDLIFNDDVIFGEFRNLSPEQIVDEALRRQAEHAGRSGKPSPA